MTKNRFSKVSRFCVAVCGLLAGFLLAPSLAFAQACERTITADVVALDQVFFWNRLGAVQPHGVIFALERVAGMVNLPFFGTSITRYRKRPPLEPIVLRHHVDPQMPAQIACCR